MASVESGVTHRLVAVTEAVGAEIIGAAYTLRDRIAGQLTVDTAGPCCFCLVDREEGVDLAGDVVEVTGLVTLRSAVSVSMHRIALPDDGMAGIGDGAHDAGKDVADLLLAHTRDEGQASGYPVGVESLAKLYCFGRRRCRAHLAAERIVYPTQELDVSSIEIPGAFSDPQHVC